MIRKFIVPLGAMALALVGFTAFNVQEGYAGKPFVDGVQAKAMQQLPGKLQCEFYDVGGPGVAYSDTDEQNNGSGMLNPGTDYLSTFRKTEAPDISFTKYHDSIDNSPYGTLVPKDGELYLGWTMPGEWTTYTVAVKQSGKYKISVRFTSHAGAKISIASSDGANTGSLDIPSTYNAADPIDWRQWHHWSQLDSLTTIDLKKGVQQITLHILEEGNCNFDFLEFSPVD